MQLNNQYQQIYDQALQSIYANNMGQAEYYCNEVLKAYPKYGEALHLLGIIKNNLGQLQEAENYFNKAILNSPPNAVYYTNLGETHKRLGNIEKAIYNLRLAIQINPEFAGAKYNLGNILKSQKNFGEAIQLYQQAIQLNPDDEQSYYNLANTFFEIGEYNHAIQCYNQTLRINNDMYEAHYNLANTLHELKRWDEAIVHSKEIIRLKPDYKDAYKLIGIALETNAKDQAAKKYYQTALQLEPENTALQLHIDTISPWVNLSSYEIDDYRYNVEKTVEDYLSKNIKLSIENISDNPQPTSTLIYQGRNNKALKEHYAQIFRNSFTPFDKKFDTSSKKIKLGFLVTTGMEGIFTKFTKNIINNISNADFDLTIICNIKNAEKLILPSITNPEVKYLAFSKHFKDSVQEIANFNFDVIYHWEIGTDAQNYAFPFFKLAPVQFTSLGWPETSGIKEVDYFISSDFLELPEAQNHYTEQLFKFKNLPFCVDKPNLNVEPKDRSYFTFASNERAYVCVQNLRKLHPDFDKVTAEILRRDPNGILVLVEDKYENITELVRNRIRTTYPDIYKRVRFLPKLSYSDYLNLLLVSDVLLDTFYFGGANTSYEAFALGTPIVTLPWDLQRGRFTYASYKHLEISDCIAKNEQEYIDFSIKIANNKDIKTYISNKMKERSSILFNNLEVVKEFENFIKKVVNK